MTVPTEVKQIQNYKIYTQRTKTFDSVQESLDDEEPDWLADPIEKLEGRGVWIGLRSGVHGCSAGPMIVEAIAKRLVESVLAHPVDPKRSTKFSSSVAQLGDRICFFTGDGIHLDCMYIIPRLISSAVLAAIITPMRKQFVIFREFCVKQDKENLARVEGIPPVGSVLSANLKLKSEPEPIIDHPMNGQFANKTVHWGIDKEYHFAQIGQRRVSLSTGQLRVMDIDFAIDRTMLKPRRDIKDSSGLRVPFLLPRQQPFQFETRQQLGRYLLINMRDSFAFHYHFGTSSFWEAVDKISASVTDAKNARAEASVARHGAKKKRSRSDDGAGDDDVGDNDNDDGDNDNDNADRGKRKRRKAKQPVESCNPLQGEPKQDDSDPDNGNNDKEGKDIVMAAGRDFPTASKHTSQSRSEAPSGGPSVDGRHVFRLINVLEKRTSILMEDRIILAIKLAAVYDRITLSDSPSNETLRVEPNLSVDDRRKQADTTPRYDVATDYVTKLLEVLRLNTALDPEGSRALAAELAAQSPSTISESPSDDTLLSKSSPDAAEIIPGDLLFPENVARNAESATNEQGQVGEFDGVLDFLDIVRHDAVEAFDSLPDTVDRDAVACDCEYQDVLHAFDMLAAKVMQGEEVKRSRTEVREDMKMLQQKTRFYVYMAIMFELKLKDSA
ncbi:hypothetical protein CYLTODRAFT_484598 [Cylindrobasidium torrendii FP15055 ss-10]|uniref:Uncharacterized protein n=1 Tax=Cylindrobasidium torrendii FP15055 ss-10 TaxID=1314674 RepID=A0A0D7BVS2_9AGAR|nr:hypothetical protein CYLTODRAFT_484598 [Cylindrobasidium torrendii FP15055 ss-10]